MLSLASVIVIVPARNEAPRIEEVLATLPSFVDEAIVIDDGSTDETSAIVARLERRRVTGEWSGPTITLLRHSESRGVGAAIVSGYRQGLANRSRASHPNDAMVVMAGDGQMDPADLLPLVGPVVRGEAGYVKGNRFASTEARAMPSGRRLAGEVLSRATSWVTGLEVHDSQCGFTALSRSAAEGLDLDALWPRYGYPNDLLAQLAARRVVVREVIVRPIYRGEPSGVRPWHVARITWLLARALIRQRRAAQGAVAGPAQAAPAE